MSLKVLHRTHFLLFGRVHGFLWAMLNRCKKGPLLCSLEHPPPGEPGSARLRSTHDPLERPPLPNPASPS